MFLKNLQKVQHNMGRVQNESAKRKYLSSAGDLALATITSDTFLALAIKWILFCMGRKCVLFPYKKLPVLSLPQKSMLRGGRHKKKHV